MANEKHETITDIAAAMRDYSNACNDGYLTEYSVVCTDMRNYADRIEAAAKRESELSKNTSKNEVDLGQLQLGNAAKLREACMQAIGELNCYIRNCSEKADTSAQRAVALLRKALAAPPRNCDRFDDKSEAMVAFLNEKWFVAVADLKEYPFRAWSFGMKAMYAKWLFAPTTEMEGGNDGK